MAVTTVAFSKRSQHKLEFTLSSPTISATQYSYTYSARMVTSNNTLRPYASGLQWRIDVLIPSTQNKGSGTYSYDFRSPTSLNATFSIGSGSFTINRPASTASDVTYSVRFIANTSNTTELIGTATSSQSVTIAKQVPATPAPTWNTLNYTANVYVGSAMTSQQFTATGATSYSLASGSLPSGISLSSSGLLSGTPSSGATQTFTFRINATNSGGTTQSNQFSITRNQALPSWIDDTLSTDLRVGTFYSDSVSANNTTSYSVTGLPSGGLSHSSGTVSGIPSTTSTISFTITASNSDGATSNRSYNLTPKPRLAIWTDESLFTTTIKKGQSYSDGVSADYAVSYGLDSGTLPPGITLDTTFGGLSGEPTTVGTYNFVLFAANSSDEQIFTNELSITVEPAGSGKVWNGSAWVEAPFQVWNGSSWAEGPAKVWNGSSWIDPTV